MNRKENRLGWACITIGVGVGFWLGSWLAPQAPFALFCLSYPVMFAGLFLLSRVGDEQ